MRSIFYAFLIFCPSHLFADCASQFTVVGQDRYADVAQHEVDVALTTLRQMHVEGRSLADISDPDLQDLYRIYLSHRQQDGILRETIFVTLARRLVVSSSGAIISQHELWETSSTP